MFVILSPPNDQQYVFSRIINDFWRFFQCYYLARSNIKFLYLSLWKTLSYNFPLTRNNNANVRCLCAFSRTIKSENHNSIVPAAITRLFAILNSTLAPGFRDFAQFFPRLQEHMISSSRPLSLVDFGAVFIRMTIDNLSD